MVGNEDKSREKRGPDSNMELGAHPLHDFIAGSVGGVVGLLVGHPFDTTKVLIQTKPSAVRQNAIIEALHHIRSFGIVRGFYRGAMGPVCTYGAVNALFFGVYGNSLKLLMEYRQESNVSYTDIYIAGCVGGVANTLVASPIDLVKVILQSQIRQVHPQTTTLKLQPTDVRYYTGPIACVKDIYRRRGIRGLCKGMGVMMLRDVPTFGLYSWAFEYTTDAYFRKGFGQKTSFVSTMFAGGVAGCLSWAACMPFDVIKTRLQSDFEGKYKGIIDCGRKLVAKEGVRALFKGLMITLIRAFPVNAATFTMYSQTLSFLGRFRFHD